MRTETPKRVSEKAMFLLKFIQRPRTVGSVTPSSRALGEKMTEHIDWSEAEAVAELGSGTGVFTRLINRRKRKGCRVALFEKDEQMRGRMEREFPSFPCFDDASNMRRSLESAGMPKLDCVISGLPFANIEFEQRERILDEVLGSLKEDGVFVAFQYSLQMKKEFESKFSSVEVSFVLQNFPPAFVYVCRR